MPEGDSRDPDPKRAALAARRERLAAELRANLRRRKAQARTRGQGADAPRPAPTKDDAPER
jgi:hypothetical protein